MSGQLNDVILMLHAPDGSSWAKFMLTRLELPPYEIKSISKDLTILEGPPEEYEVEKAPDEPHGDQDTDGELYLNTSDILSQRESTGSSTGDGDANNNTSLNTDKNPNSPSTGDDATPGSASKKEQSTTVVTLNESSSMEDCILYSRACIIFLSPEIIENECPFPIDISCLNPRSTVFLFLGVEIHEVRQFFGSQSEHVFRCLCSHIDASEVSICDALVQIVNAYEDTGGCSSISGGSDLQELDPDDVSGEGVYQKPSSVQLNRVEKVFPRELTGGERLVYVLLKQQPEHEVVVEMGSTKQEFPLTQVCDRLFSFSVPDGLCGKVSFVIGSQGHEIGSESVRVMSRMDQLQEILAEEVEPRNILAQAVGVAPGDDASLDTALALRLQQLASAYTFARLFPVEETLQIKGQGKQVMYPSLLHFAADYNLRTFCSELLRYPSMAGAAQTENKDGETPRLIAARKQFLQLESDLTQFASRHGISENQEVNAEDRMYVQPTSPQDGCRPPPPPAHRPTKAAGYVNSGVETYITMGEVQHPGKSDLLSVKHQLSSIETRQARELPDLPGITNFRNDLDEEDGGKPFEYQNWDTMRADSGISQGSRSGSARSSPRDRLDTSVSPEDSPRTSARKALKVMGVTEDEIRGSRLLSNKPGSFDSEDKISSHAPERNRFFSNSTPKNMALGRASVGSMSSDQFDANEQISPKQSKNKMKKFKKFFIGKSKDKRSSSLSSTEMASDIKDALAARGRRGSESSVTTIHRETMEERDSGSYSDEEKEKPPLPAPRRNPKNKVFKEREDAMKRRLSRRAQAAMNEKIDIAPTLPSRTGRRRGAFKSFIMD